MDKITSWHLPVEVTIMYVANVPMQVGPNQVQMTGQTKIAKASLRWQDIHGVQEFQDHHLFPANEVPKCRIVINMEEQTTYVACVPYEEMKERWHEYLDYKHKQTEDSNRLFKKSNSN